MARYAPDLQPSTFGTSQYAQDPYIMDSFNRTETPSSEGFQYSPMIKESVKTGLQAGQAGGGLGGILTAGGANAALMGAGPVGWGVMAGGLLLSAKEKKEQEEAAREQARIKAEMDKRSNLIALARDASQNDFRLV